MVGNARREATKFSFSQQYLILKYIMKSIQPYLSFPKSTLLSLILTFLKKKKKSLVFTFPFQLPLTNSFSSSVSFSSTVQKQKQNKRSLSYTVQKCRTILLNLSSTKTTRLAINATKLHTAQEYCYSQNSKQKHPIQIIPMCSRNTKYSNLLIK